MEAGIPRRFNAAQPSGWRVVEVLRWLGVLPAAFFASTFVGYFFKFLVMFCMVRFGSLRESEVIYWICYALVMLPKNAAFVFTGTLVAPRARPATAAALAAIATALAVVIHITSRSRVGFTNYRDLAAAAAGALLAAACVALGTRRNQDRAAISDLMPSTDS